MTTIRYFAGAAQAAGTETTEVRPRAGQDLGSLAADLGARNADLAKVLAVASFVVDGTVTSDRALVIDDAAAIDVLPPFAGG
ncbi:MAG: MoaD/ThiS family protein [Bowdeniella nasicola]|nr:MoaD/ThiS family protein [Bowdeniella nasicola]